MGEFAQGSTISIICGSLAKESHDLPQVMITKPKKETCSFYDVHNRHSQAVMDVNSDMHFFSPMALDPELMKIFVV